jgi:hypothetical protein
MIPTGETGVLRQCHLVHHKTHKARTVTHMEGPRFEAGEHLPEPWNGQRYVVNVGYLFPDQTAQKES